MMRYGDGLQDGNYWNTPQYFGGGLPIQQNQPSHDAYYGNTSMPPPPPTAPFFFAPPAPQPPPQPLFPGMATPSMHHHPPPPPQPPQQQQQQSPRISSTPLLRLAPPPAPPTSLPSNSARSVNMSSKSGMSIITKNTEYHNPVNPVHPQKKRLKNKRRSLEATETPEKQPKQQPSLASPGTSKQGGGASEGYYYEGDNNYFYDNTWGDYGEGAEMSEEADEEGYSMFGGATCGPAMEMTPRWFAPSGPRVFNPEQHRKVCEEVVAAMPAEEQERMSLLLPCLTARSVFRGQVVETAAMLGGRPVNDGVKRTFPLKSKIPLPFNADPTSAFKTTMSPAISSVPSSNYVYRTSTKLVRRNGPSPPKTTVISSTVSPVASSTDGAPPAKKPKLTEPTSNTKESTPSELTISSSDENTVKKPSMVEEMNKLKERIRAGEMSRPASAPSLKALAAVAVTTTSGSTGTVTSSPVTTSPAPTTVSAASSSAKLLSSIPSRGALSLRRINGVAVTPEMGYCHSFLQNGTCRAGVLCRFEHKKKATDSEEVERKVCGRMLRGLCRGEHPCTLPHPIQKHQLPICDFFLRVSCLRPASECSLMHVKHHPSVPYCIHFNRGCCSMGDECQFQHVYNPDVVSRLSVYAEPTGFRGSHAVEDEAPCRRESPTSNDSSLLDWIV